MKRSVVKSSTLLPCLDVLNVQRTLNDANLFHFDLVFFDAKLQHW